MSDDGGQRRGEPDTRERAQLLREVARQFRAVDPAELTAQQLALLCEVIPTAASRGQPGVDPASECTRVAGPAGH